jgi:hypothetical protein
MGPLTDGETKRRAGAGLISKTPQGGIIHHSFSLLKEECSNNEADEAFLFGHLLALSMDVRNILVYGVVSHGSPNPHQEI